MSRKRESVIKKRISEKVMDNNKIWGIVAVLLSLLIAIVSASISTGEVKEKVSNLAQENVHYGERISTCELNSVERDVMLGKIETDINYITKAVDEIREDLKELQKGGGT